ncbi:MAG: hypothetical protein IJ562_05345 [Prevotella sp.]|nr:hypothetical protein [Prevotella sp.]
MKDTAIIIFFTLLLLFFRGMPLAAQQGQAEEETHAHASAMKWKGIDVEAVLNNPAYANEGKKFYLYNVGTGRFVIEGGNWGMEGRLFHEDFGRALHLMSNGYIKSGITEQSTSTKIMFGCNVPGVSKPTSTWSQYNQYSFTVLMDVDSKYLTPWKFQRVETDTNADTYTYYMWEAMPVGNPKNYYLGAAWGEWHVAADKGDGEFVYLDADRSCWTTGSVVGNNEKKDVDGDMISIDELYQWRLISEEEFINVLNNEVVGINPSISSLVPDRDFPRNSDNFDANWVMEEQAGAGSAAKGRLGYTFGIYLNNASQNKYYNNEAWNKPVRLKALFNNFSNAKYCFLSFEGVGRTYTSFVVPNPGWYQVQCYGFIQSDSNHDAYLFAKVKGSSGSTSYGGESSVNLQQVASGTFTGKNVEEKCLAVGKELTHNGQNYLNTLWICVTNEQFDSGDDEQKTLLVGVGKDEATQSSGIKNGNTTYYYDTDWVCIDDIRVSYMGLGPVFFYEDEENLDYLRFDQDNLKQYMSATPNGQYSGAACIERTFKKNQWNSFSFPLPLTGEQMRLAFGEDAQLARIHSIGKLSQNPNVIDFQTVSLLTSEYVVEPGNVYLLKPNAEPVQGIDPRGRNASFYNLGRMFFSVNETEPETYKFPRMSLGIWNTNEQHISSLQNNDGQASAIYVQTPEYNDFTVSDNTYVGGVADGLFAPKSSYVVSNNTIYHINKDTRLKGFRGWITLEHPIPQTSVMTMAVNGKQFVPEANDEYETAIKNLYPPSQNHDINVYDLCGRKVSVLGKKLPKGVYVANGKTLLIK